MNRNYKNSLNEIINKSKNKYETKIIKDSSFLPTSINQDKSINKENENENKNENENDINIKNNFGIITINLNDIKNSSSQDSYQTLHNYTFEEAIIYDKRSIFKICYIYLLSKQILFHTFLQRSPLEVFTIRLLVFIFMFSCDLALNALLYLNDNISKKYNYAKNLFLFTFSNNITIILLSTLLSFILISLISKLTNSTNAIRNVFRKEEDKIKKDKKYKPIHKKRKKEIFLEIENILKKLKIKIIAFIIIEIILILFFWYFVTAFCHV